MANFNASLLGSKKKREALGRGIAYLLLITLSVIFAFPLFWLLSTSLKPDTQIFMFPPKLIPNPIVWQNYIKVLPLLRFRVTVVNSLVIAFGEVMGTVISSSLVAYSFARLRWPGRDILFVALLSTMMIPYAVTMIPIFIVFNKLGWINTFKPLIVPSFLGNAFYIFLLRQFFLTIPTDLSDAARIDGCSELGIYWRIVLPLSKSTVAVVAIFAFLNGWNDFLGPLIYLNDQNKWTLSLALHAMRSAQIGEINWSGIMAGSAMMTVPIIILFFFTQKSFIQGITLTGLKE